MSRIIEPNPKQRISIEEIIADPWFSLIHICCRQTQTTNNSSIPNMSCAVNAVNQQPTSISETSITNMI
jgi:hypothetical protein